MSASKPTIPPLAGLATHAEAAAVGLSVDENVERLRRCNYVERRLVEIATAFLNPTPEWEVKCALSLHLWLDAEHSQALRQRVAELRRPPLYLDTAPDPRLKALMDEVERSMGALELLAGAYGVIRPALLLAYREHMSDSHPVFDQPTRRLLRMAAIEEEEMMAWGEAALAALTPDAASKAQAAAWQAHLTAYLQAAGGIAGTAPVPDGLSLPAARATSPCVPDVRPVREARSGPSYNFHYRPDEIYQDEAASLAERTMALMFKRLHEMDVPEMMASILLQTPGKPWEYYREMSRQLWDETRHAMMGEVWFAARGVDWASYPNHVGWSLHMNLDREPLERHAILYAIEHGLMDGKTGKRYELEIMQQAQDALAAHIQDYDWADEVLHAQIGRRWLKPVLGDSRAIIA